jgi:hypothetical protein
LVNWKRPHNLPAILDSLYAEPRIREVIVWDNSGTLAIPRAHVIGCGRNICTLGRFKAIDLATSEAIYTQDDDIVVRDIPAILDAYEEGKIVASLTPGHMRAEAGKKPWVQLGWGSVFSRLAPACLNEWMDRHGEDLLLERKADRIFTILHGNHVYREASVEPLKDPDGRESQSSRDALYRKPDHNVLTQRASELAMEIRRAVA